MSTFYSGFLEVYLKTVKEEISVLISCFEKEVGKWFDVVPYAKRVTLGIICDTAMGYKHNAQRNSKNKHVEAVDKIACDALHEYMDRKASIIAPLAPVYIIFNPGRIKAR